MSWITIRSGMLAVFPGTQIKLNYLKGWATKEGEITAWPVVLGGNYYLLFVLIHCWATAEDETDLLEQI